MNLRHLLLFDKIQLKLMSKNTKNPFSAISVGIVADRIKCSEIERFLANQRYDI